MLVPPFALIIKGETYILSNMGGKTWAYEDIVSRVTQ